MDNIELIKTCWLEVMPESSVSARTFLKSTCVSFHLVKSSKECVNGILENDHLQYTGWVEDGVFREDRLYMFVKPTKANMVYGSVKLRKATVKIDRDALIKRFTKVKEWIKAEYNLNSKV